LTLEGLVIRFMRSLREVTSMIRMTKSRRMRWAGQVARMGSKRNAYSILVRKPEGKRPRGRQRRRWVDTIKMMDWIDLA
jgi:hypothetical protein